MSLFGLTVAMTGIVLSVSAIVYSLWHLLDLLADKIDEREMARRRKMSY